MSAAVTARIWTLGALLAGLLFSFPSRAAEAPLSLPPPAPVVDEYGLLGADDVSRLDALVRQIKARSGVEVTVYIPSSLRGLEIEDFSIRVAERWQLGRKKEDKGLLLVVAPRERRMRIEVGYGLEGDLTDAFTRRVLDEGMRPLFREGRYYDGIVNALALLQSRVPLGLKPDEVPDEGPHLSSVLVLFVLFFLFLVLSSFVRAFSGRGGYYGGWGGGSSWGGGGWTGGGGGGSSWGGGGGGFGGGGSSSSW